MDIKQYGIKNERFKKSQCILKKQLEGYENINKDTETYEVKIKQC